MFDELVVTLVHKHLFVVAMLILVLSELSSTVPLLVSLALVSASLGLACSLIALLLRRSPSNSWSRLCQLSQERLTFLRTPLKLASSTLWLSVTAMHLWAWHLCLFQSPREQLHGISYISTLVAMLLGWQLWNKSCGVKSATRGLGMQVLQIVGLVACSSVYPSDRSEAVVTGPPGTLVTVQTAVTDRGSRIPVYERKIDDSELAMFYQESQSQVAAVARFAMLKGEALSQVNCHGWVFTGRHIIKGEDVRTILRDNGYERVNSPQLNDLIVYEDPQGTIVHTGIVGGFLRDNQPLIESKWGIAGSYLHLPQEQPYSKDFVFYRSPRLGHQLQYSEPPAESGTLLTSHAEAHATQVAMLKEEPAQTASNRPKFQ